MTTTKGRPQETGPAPTTHQSTGPARAFRRSVIGRSPWFENGTPEQRRRIHYATGEAARTAAHCRALVLAHPDLSEQLVSRLGYSRAEAWSGFIPPRFYEAGSQVEHWRPNSSPVRALLVELVAAAEARRST